MRRAALALLGTTIGTSLLVGAKLGTPAPAGAEDVAVDAAGGVAADGPLDASADPATLSPSAPTATAGPSSKPKTTAPTGTKTTAPAGGTKTAAPKPAATGLKSGTFTGAPSTHRYGTVQVTITVSGGKVTKATATYPTDRSTSAEINNDAVPKLISETLSAQSARIATVSGATLTSNAYKISLQSALDKAKA